MSCVWRDYNTSSHLCNSTITPQAELLCSSACFDVNIDPGSMVTKWPIIMSPYVPN